MTEEELISACKKGNAFAQKLFFDQYWEKVFLICIRYVRHQEIAEEILSDIFLKAFESVETFQFRGAGSLMAWLSRIAVNQCLMYLRRKKKMIFSDESTTILENIPELPANHIIEALNAKDLVEMIQELPSGYRAVFNLYVIENYSHKAIAGLLNITENTSKSQLRKARLALQQKIKNHEQ